MSHLTEAFAKLHIADRDCDTLRLQGAEARALARHLDAVEEAVTEASRILRICERSADTSGWERTCRQASQALDAVAEPIDE